MRAQLHQSLRSSCHRGTASCPELVQGRCATPTDGLLEFILHPANSCPLQTWWSNRLLVRVSTPGNVGTKARMPSETALFAGAGLTLLLSLRFMSLVFEEARNIAMGLAARNIDWKAQARVC